MNEYFFLNRLNFTINLPTSPNSCDLSPPPTYLLTPTFGFSSISFSLSLKYIFFKYSILDHFFNDYICLNYKLLKSFRYKVNIFIIKFINIFYHIFLNYQKKKQKKTEK